MEDDAGPNAGVRHLRRSSHDPDIIWRAAADTEKVAHAHERLIGAPHPLALTGNRDRFGPHRETAIEGPTTGGRELKAKRAIGIAGKERDTDAVRSGRVDGENWITGQRGVYHHRQAAAVLNH